MSMSEVLNDIIMKTASKNTVGDVILHGITIGTVVENANNENKGMVRVEIPTREKSNNILEWMKISNNMAGEKWGSYCIPEIGDKVIVIFEDGNIHNPYVIGSIYVDKSEIIDNFYDKNNFKKGILTKGGNSVVVNDKDDAQSIEIKTKKGHKFIMTDEKNIMSLEDSNSKNILTYKTEDGELSIKAANKMTVDVNGTKITIVGDSGKISIKCDSLDIDAQQRIGLKAQNILIDGSNINLKASGSASLKASGMAEVKGQVVKIN